MNDILEGMWKEAVVASLRHYTGICLEELRKTMNIGVPVDYNVRFIEI
jgi:hypothetical protein